MSVAGRQTWGQTAGEREVHALHVTRGALSSRSHARGSQAHAGRVAHARQCLDSFGEVMCDDPPVLPPAAVPAHPGQGGAAHGVVDGLLGWRHNSVRRNMEICAEVFNRYSILVEDIKR